MLLVGALGTLVAGPAADRFGRRPVLMASLVAIAAAHRRVHRRRRRSRCDLPRAVGACVVGTFGVTMVMSQEYLPRHIGMASGLSIGFSIGLGGIAAVILGALADSVDLRTALWTSALGRRSSRSRSAARLPSSRRRARARLQPVGEP